MTVNNESNAEIRRREVEAAYSPVAGMNRAQRRALDREGKKSIKRKRDFRIPTKRLGDIEEIIDDDKSLASLNKDLLDYEQAQEFTKYQRQYYKILLNTGLSQQTAKRFIDPTADQIGMQTQARLEQNRLKDRQNNKQLTNLQNILRRLEVFQDDEEKEIFSGISNTDVTIDDVFKETLRARQASIDLIKMQIDYLQSEEEKNKKAEAERLRQREEDEQLKKMITEEEAHREEATIKPQIQSQIESRLEVAASTEPFPLENWQIYWTSRFWSDNPNHLTKIEMTDWETAVEQIDKASDHQISIGAKSVVRALEFHLHDRDRIQRALATRNKYAPEEIRRWVKVKRGKERIGILIDEDKPNTAIFFVGGRDVVYRGL